MTRADDKAFWRAWRTVSDDLVWRVEVEGATGRKPPTHGEVRRAADVMASYAVKHADDVLVWQILREQARDYIARGRAVPAPIVRAFVDKPEQTKRRRGRNPPGLMEREIRRTHASWVNRLLEAGNTKDEALSHAEAMKCLPGPKSAKTLARHLDWAKQEPT